MLLNFFDELGDADVASAGQSAIPDEETATTDGSCHAIEKGEGLPGGRRLIEYLRDRDHVLVPDRGAVPPGPQLHTSVLAEAYPADPKVVDCVAHCAAMETIDEVRRHRKLAVVSWRED